MFVSLIHKKGLTNMKKMLFDIFYSTLTYTFMLFKSTNVDDYILSTSGYLQCMVQKFIRDFKLSLIDTLIREITTVKMLSLIL